MAASKHSPEDRMKRKRLAARLRQQRCRARKRAQAVSVAVTIASLPNCIPAPAEAVPPPEQQQPAPPAKSASEIAAIRKRRKMAWLEKKGECVRASDGSLVSKRTANQMAFLDEYNRKFLAKVEAAENPQTESKDDAMDEEQHDAKENAPVPHVVVSQAPARPRKTQTKARPRSPAKYTAYPPGAHYYAYHQRLAAYHHRRATHGKYMPHPPPSAHHMAYPMPPPGPVPIYVAPYGNSEGRYRHPHHPHHSHHSHHAAPRSMPPPQHSMMPTALEPAMVSRSVSDDDRSTPSPELSPSSASLAPTEALSSTTTTAAPGSLDESALQSKEQEAIAAMLFLSSSGLDLETAAAPAPTQSMLMSQ
jgi:hypothetical protein